MNENREYNKVIGIGFHKTGTTTLGVVLLELGFKVLGARVDLGGYLLKGEINRTIQAADAFDALQDNPWAVLYKELDRAYPKSKFILLEREEDKWINSVVKHFGESYTDMRKWIYGYGVALGNEEVYIKRYKKHNREVKDYFKDRPEDLLILSWNTESSWDKICTFLDLPIPLKPFPHENKGKHNLKLIEKIFIMARSILPVKISREILNILGIPDERNRFNNQYENKAYRESIKDKQNKLN